METEWNKLSEAERVEFAEWKRKKAEAVDPKMYRDMTPAEQKRFRERHTGRLDPVGRR